jgi:nucleoid DNA-binding protein
MATVTKKDIVDRIVGKSGLHRSQVKQVIHNFLDEIINELQLNNRLEFRDFGVFECRWRNERIARNPKTDKHIRVPGRRTVRFKTGRRLKAKLIDSVAIPDKTLAVKVNS